MQYIKRHKVPFIIAAALIVAALVLFLALRGGGYPKTNAAAVAAVPFAYDGDALYRICAAANHHLTLTISPVVK